MVVAWLRSRTGRHTTGRLWTREEIQARYGIERATFYTLTHFKRTAIHASKRGR
jgi:hypothetical protein